jgi:hypothetical protein
MERTVKRFVTGKWRLLVYVLLLGIIVTVWRPLYGCYYLVRIVGTQYVEEARISRALNSAGIPIGSLSCGMKQGISLRLEGPEVRSISTLSGFRVARLILRDTSVRDLTPLEGSDLFLLDLRGTAVTNLATVATMPHLNELILSKRQITENMQLLRGLRVFVGEDDSEFVLPGGIAWSNRYERIEKRS